MDYTTMMLTVAETALYVKKAERLLSAAERDEIITFLSRSPKAGVLVRGTGGIRKVRWGKGSQGKSSGVRVIYYFHSDLMPLYLVTMFGKNEQSNLSAGECNQLVDLGERLKSIWIRKKR
jgi:mRNA-degrading endonuclease RelE of RelBE toxin-antitoxin system